MKKIVIALGGNALQEAGKPATAEAQLEVVEKTSEYIADIIGEGYKVIIAHGNGPQVGRIVLQNEYATPVSPAMPFDVCGAMSQGYIGYHIQQGLTKVLRSRGNKSEVATVVTQVLVDRNDPKFKNPSKPIGPFYTEEEAKKIGAVDFLAQGTIYPDVVESGLGGESAVIKSHHNVGGLPDFVDFKEIIEPLRDLFKDEVRKAGLELGIPERLVFRQPFPGPGLGIRIIGEVTAEKVKMVQDADAIWREEIDKAGIAHEIGQYFAALTNMRSVGVMGDERTYDYAIALRAVTTTDFMTAESAEIPWDVIGRTTSRIVNEVKHINRVMYDCTGKPPATIEFE